MSHVFITGDTHGSIGIDKFSHKKWPEGKQLTKNDYVIVAGDFGLIWSLDENNKDELYWLKWLSEKKWTTLFIDGNHENFNRLNQLPIQEKFGGKVGVVRDNIFHLKRGEIYTIYNKTFFCFGGAKSHDRSYRTLNKTYWEEEIPNSQEMEHAHQNLNRVNNKVDYIITHTVPDDLIPILQVNKNNIDPTRRFLNFIISNTSYERYFCGHMHIDKDLGKFSLLYNRIIQIF